MRYAVGIANTTREPEKYGLQELEPYIAYGASPRGSINLVHAARALALVRGRRYVLPQDVRELAKDVLRHRIVLTYQALAEERSPDAILDRVLDVLPVPQIDLARAESA
jgi:MoxR-like ATPase